MGRYEYTGNNSQTNTAPKISNLDSEMIVYTKNNKIYLTPKVTDDGLPKNKLTYS